MKYLLALFTATSVLGALPSVGPDYTPPTVATPAAYRDAAGSVGWKTASENSTIPPGDWWTLFHDPVLDELEAAALRSNPDLLAAAARVEQARALAGAARSAYWPGLTDGASFNRERTSSTTDNIQRDTLTNTYRVPLSAMWELDLFGRVRRMNESARAEAEASAATLEAARVSLTAEIASTYFSLRAFEREIALVRDSVALRRRALDLVQAKVKSGTATDLDAARAETELATAEAEASGLSNQRSQLQNALAVLAGRTAPDFSLGENTGAPPQPPAIPSGLPSELLERRPDVAAAERALASANARIGVAKAAFFPAISLTGAAGYASGDVDTLFNSDSRVWSIGPSLYLPIFQGGRNRANLARNRAAYDEAVAVFRKHVLTALREVQDALTATRVLQEQSVAQERALAAAKRAARLAQTRYDSGYVSYLEVIDAQRTSLAIERASTQLDAKRLNTSIALIKALGGGWTRPNRSSIAQNDR